MTRTTDAERAEFEAWYEADAMPAEADWFTREKDDPSEYKHADTASAWSGWQASRRAPAVPVPQGLFEAIEHGDETHRGWLKSALEAFFSGKPIPQEVSTAKHPPAAAPVPEGWALVPLEVTQEMIEAWVNATELPEGMAERSDDEVNAYAAQRDWKAMLAVAPAVPVPQSIEQMAVDRYKVVPSHSSMFYPCAVVAGDGQQQLYIGREVECQNMARKFTGAFLDGAFVALAAAPQSPEAAPVELPEPVAYLHECGKKPSLRTLEFSKVAIQLSAKGYKSLPLYTEQQVIDLLKSVGVTVKP